MRKRSVNHIADTIFWYVVYMLPLILTIIQSIGIFGGMTFDGWLTISDAYNMLDFDFMTLLTCNLEALGVDFNGVVSTTLESLFGDGGILPMVTDATIFGFGEWFVCTLLVHLCVDFVLFIPRIAHKWLDDFVKKESK